MPIISAVFSSVSELIRSRGLLFFSIFQDKLRKSASWWRYFCKKKIGILTLEITFLFHLFPVGFLPDEIEIVDGGPYPVARGGRRRDRENGSSIHSHLVSSCCRRRRCWRRSASRPGCNHPCGGGNGRRRAQNGGYTRRAGSVRLPAHRRCASRRRCRFGRVVIFWRVNGFVCYKWVGTGSFETIVLVVARSIDRHDNGRRFNLRRASGRTVDGRD